MKQLFAIVLLCGILVSCSDDEMATMEYMGGTYKGEVANGEPNGQGTLTLPDGRKFVGKFKDGKIDGQGTFTFPDRTKGVGYFRGTKPWNVTKYDKEGTILGKYVNGKWIKN